MNIDEKLEENIENKYLQNDKDKNKMELTIEESVYILKRRDFNAYVEEIAIETLLTAYEKEKEKNKKLRDKILFKVEEIKDRPVLDEFITASRGKLNTIIDIESILIEEE